MSHLKILVPTDFSKNATYGVKYAIQFAAQTQSDLLFFHSTCSLIPTSGSRDSYEMAVKKEILLKEELLKKTVEKIYHLLEIPLNPNKVQYGVTYGTSVVDDILEAAEEKHVDLVISATKGATGLKKVFFGSNTASIISKSPVPVLAIPAKVKYQPLNEIIYSTDLLNFENELNQVKSLCNKFSLNYTIVNFAPGGFLFPEEKELVKKIKALEPKFAQRSFPIDQPLTYKIENYMKKHKGSVLGMFKESRSGFTKFILGSITEDLTFDLKFPLLVFKKEKVLELA